MINFEFPDGFVCQGCGNKKAMCHQFLWGGNLLQEAVSKFDKRKHTFEIDSEDVKEDMKQKYNLFLRSYLYREHWQFEEKEDYDMPECLVEGTLKVAMNLINAKLTLAKLHSRRGYGIAHQYFKFDSRKIASGADNEDDNKDDGGDELN